MYQEIYIIDDNMNLVEQVSKMLELDKKFKVKSVNAKNLDVALKDIPALIIIDEDNTNSDVIEICKQIRENEDNSITPIIVISSNSEKEHRMSVFKAAVEYYILKPIETDYLYYTIKNIIRLMHANRKVSPLTGLPRKCSNK